MLYHNVRVLSHIGGFIDAGVAVLAAVAGATLAAEGGGLGLQAHQPAVWLLLIGFVLAFVIISGRMGLYHPWRTEPLWREMVALFESAAYAMGLATILAMVVGRPIPGPLLATMLISGLLGVGVFRLLSRLLIRRLRSRGDDYRVWLVVGRNTRSAELVAEICANPRYGIRIAAVVDFGTPSAPQWSAQSAGPDGGAVHSMRDVEELRQILEREVIDEVVITLPLRSCYDAIHAMLRICSQAGISVKLLPEAFEMPASRRHLAHIGGTAVLTHYSGTGNYGQMLFKRLIDMTCAVAGLLVMAPVLVAIAITVRCSSPGPVLFRQTRVGLHGRQFTIRKFRTMFADAELRRTEMTALNERDGTAFKMRDDPRITAAGRWLRKFHLDELPQLWNVMVGDMSLVGPRPLPVKEAIGNEWWQRRRLTVPPGLTCLWQLHDDPLIPFQQWMRMDMDYIDRWSIWLDLRIICLTFGTLARGRGW